jgi:hypothetical protein
MSDERIVNPLCRYRFSFAFRVAISGRTKSENQSESKTHRLLAPALALDLRHRAAEPGHQLVLRPPKVPNEHDKNRDLLQAHWAHRAAVSSKNASASAARKHKLVHRSSLATAAVLWRVKKRKTRNNTPCHETFFRALPDQ